MDRVRFGRALGFGTRQAVKTLVATVDAAMAENPSSKKAGSGYVTQRSPQASPAKVPQSAADRVSKTTSQAREVKQGIGRGSRRFGHAVWNPFVRLSGVLWLEVTGVFFGIFALFALGAMWRLRGEWHVTATNAQAHRSLLGAVLMLVVFGYFCVSSFVRAKRRERQR